VTSLVEAPMVFYYISNFSINLSNLY